MNCNIKALSILRSPILCNCSPKISSSNPNWSHRLTLWLQGIHKIRHFSCDRDFNMFRNQMYKSLFEPYNSYKKTRPYTIKTFSYGFAWFRNFKDRLNGSKYVLQIWSRKIWKSLTQEKCLILWKSPFVYNYRL